MMKPSFTSFLIFCPEFFNRRSQNAEDIKAGYDPSETIENGAHIFKHAKTEKKKREKNAKMTE